MNSNLAGLVALIQTASIAGVGGISPLPIPDRAVFTYVTVREVMGKELQTLDNLVDGLNKTVMQIDCWDSNYEAAWAVRNKLKQALLGYSDANVFPINHVNDAELYDGPRKMHQLVCRLLIWWKADDVCY